MVLILFSRAPYYYLAQKIDNDKIGLNPQGNSSTDFLLIRTSGALIVSAMKKKVLIYAPFALWSPHFETDLELGEIALSEGHEVKYLYCSGQLPTCEPNLDHKNNICALCRSRFKSGIKWIGKDRVQTEDFYNLTEAQRVEIDFLKKKVFLSVEEVRAFKIGAAEIGRAALSSTITESREPALNLLQHEKSIRKHLITAATVYYSIKNHLQKMQPDQIILFNGRLSSHMPALDVAKEMGVPAYVHERSGALERYSFLKNTTPHDIRPIAAQIEEVYNSIPLSDEEKEKIAVQWYEERRNNVPQFWTSLTKDQKEGLIPSNLTPDKVNLVIFNSSEDEMEEFAYWKNPYYKNQFEGMDRLLTSLRERDEESRIRVFLRVHPHLKGAKGSQVAGILELEKKYPELTVIHADSKVSTYALVDAADLVLTYGTTVGIEAAYRGKPLLLMARSPYEEVGVAFRPATHETFIETLLDFPKTRKLPLDLKAVRRGVIKYAVFQRFKGVNYKYVKPSSVFDVPRMQRDGKDFVVKPSLIFRATTKVMGFLDSFFQKPL